MAEKKERKISEENKALKLERELIKVKNSSTANKDATKLENDNLKENLKSLKILHKEQLRLNTARISDQNSTIKSLQRKISALEKSEAKMILLNNITGTVDHTSDESSRYKKSKLTKVCVDRTRSTLNESMLEKD